ncbi:MAG: glycerol-3-phosphate dehydrogenase/oxidase [Thermoflexaceae bacterium]|nr:glycerol-3-phosphate dehydrogenase/oxidase [Thermoflexaceae bacterium]
MTLAELAGGPPLDAAIIGGGINGTAIALDLARRGLNVALFEQDDFGFGTTWRSTRLIHGGLRYLEHGDVRLVFESLRERAWLLKARPYLVRPQRFILPVLPWTRRPAWQLRAGLTLYDMLALYRGVPAHRRLGREAAQAAMPALTPAADSAFAFYDARILSPERLALEMALEARRLGASVVNHATVTGIGVEGGRVRSVEVECEGTRTTLAANLVINAAGPWVDAVNRLSNERAPELLGVTRGTHIVVEPPEPFPHDALFSFARSDGRVFFAVPQGRLLLIGTTDDRYEGAASDVHPTAEDVAYLLDEARELLPATGIEREHVRYAFAGLRPLMRAAGGPEAAISRKHEVVDHARRGGPAGMLSVIGGKLSTFRPLAGDVAARAARGNEPDGPFLPRAHRWRIALRESGLPHEARQHLRIYGDAVEDVLAGGLAELCPHAPALESEVTHAATAELGVTLADILLRRTGIAWASCRGLCCHHRAAAIAAAVLGWDDDRRYAEIAAFEQTVAQHLPTMESLSVGGGD